MREIKSADTIIPRIRRMAEGYRRPGGPAPTDKVSPRRGLKQRWTADGGLTLHMTREDAIRGRVTTVNTPVRVFV